MTIIEITFTLASSLTDAELGLTEALGTAGEDLDTGSFIVMGTLPMYPQMTFSIMPTLFLKRKTKIVKRKVFFLKGIKYYVLSGLNLQRCSCWLGQVTTCLLGTAQLAWAAMRDDVMLYNKIVQPMRYT